MPRALILALLLSASPLLAAEPVPKGEVIKYTFETSTIFPGTVRDYWVYCPSSTTRPSPARASTSTRTVFSTTRPPSSTS